MKKVVKLSVVLLAAVVMCGLLPMQVFATAPSMSPVITSYTVSRTTINRGDTVSITVNITDTVIAAGGALPKIDAIRQVDSFTGGTPNVDITSNGGDGQLTYEIKFKDLKYSGEGQTLKFMVGYDGKYTACSLTIREAVAYVEPEYPDYTPEAIPEPTVLISRDSFSGAIQAGEEREVQISFQNLSNVALTNAVVTVTPHDSLMLMSGTATFALDRIGPRATVKTTVRVKATEQIDSEMLSMDVQLKYYYYNNISTVSGSATEQVFIPAIKTRQSTSVAEPPIIISRSALQPVRGGQEFELTLYYKNAGKTTALSPVVTVSVPECFQLQNDVSTFVLADLPAGETASLNLKLKAGRLTSNTQVISTDLRYFYESMGNTVQGSASGTVNVTCVPDEQGGEDVQSPVPNVIISDFSYGGDSVAAGSPYELNFTFRNTGTVAIENIVVVVDGGESFTMNGSTNTFYYDRVPSGGLMSQMVPMQTLATARTGAQNVTISFSYEYVSNSVRSNASTSIRLAIPVFQPDRLQINEPTLYDMAYTGMETTIVMSYINKGKSDISNVEVSISGNVDALQSTQYLGNFTSGQNGNISFVVTPWEAGEVELLITVTYEDANLSTVTREFPMTITVEDMGGWFEPYPMPDPWEDPEIVEKNQMPTWAWIAIAVGAVVVVVVVVLAVRSGKKKKAAAKASAWDEWDDEPAAVVGDKEE